MKLFSSLLNWFKPKQKVTMLFSPCHQFDGDRFIEELKSKRLDFQKLVESSHE